MDKNFYLRKSKELISKTQQALIDEASRRCEFENRMWSCIENGDYETLREITKEGMPSVIWKRQFYGENCERPFDTLNASELKDIMTIFLAVCSRYAVRGGASPIAVRTVEDLVRTDFSNNVSLDNLINLIDVYSYSMTELVRENKGKTFGIVEKACGYVTSHVYAPLSVLSVAKALKVNAHTLSVKFSKEKQMPLKAFIVKAKCEEAKALLKNTAMTIAEISEELCFSSQSHFQRAFNAVLGVTPNKYRQNPL